LDWKGKFRDAVAPLFSDLYKRVTNGTEAKIVLDKNSQPDYREKLNAELAEMGNSEMWQAGAKVRELRPENWKKEP
jgi:ketol-acid reductoisomerase